MSYINKVLVANRGEIACRVMRTAKKMGIRTVAVYSDIDKDSKFVEMADEAYNIGPAPALQSYLRSDKIIDIALHTKSEAIHPGFGFLSENAQFADDCEKNDVIFVGPPSSAIKQMGSKSESKIIMTNANVPVVPGYHGEDQDPQRLYEEARKIGFPVLIKAVLGGGGKGMKIVRKESEFQEQLESAKRESLKSFKDDRVLIEKYIEIPRHIEVQVFGDKHGNYVHLFERDCSIQRRHQKVIEEAPSQLDGLRMDIGEQAKQAARAVKYTNAGTVEFIFDLQSKKYYFMEMNTRLQVEHPISEMITGVDLVEWQLRIAAGEHLPLKQNELKINGHSIEARIYSEQPNNNFLPSNGTLKYYKEPKATENVRIESGVRQGDEISIFYDPMISKLVVWGKNRDLAIRTLLNSLQNYKVLGLPNNIYFLKQILQNPEYQKWAYDTSFIEKNKDTLLKLKEKYNHLDISFAVASKLQLQTNNHLPKSLRNFRNSNKINQQYKLQLSSPCYQNSEQTTLNVTINPDQQIYKIGDNQVVIDSITQNNDNFIFKTKEGIFERQSILLNDDIYIFDQDGDPIQVEVLSERVEQPKDVEGDQIKSVKSPMPCTLSKINVKVGQQVKKGDTLIIMEAMKMEHTVKASFDGTITEVRFKEGQFVGPGQIIIVLE